MLKMSGNKERPIPIKIYWPKKKKKRIVVEEYIKENRPLPIMINWPPSPVPFQQPLEDSSLGTMSVSTRAEEQQVADVQTSSLPSSVQVSHAEAGDAIQLGGGIILKREYDYVGGDIRFKVAVQNVSKTVLTDINVILNPTSQYEVSERIKMINFLKPNETRGVDFMLTPLTCGKSMIYGTATYVDPFGNPHSATVQPKEIWVKCPLVKAKTVEENRIAQLKKTLQKTFTTIEISGIPKTQAFKSAREQVAALDVAEVFVDEKNYQATFSGIAKVGGDELLVELEVGKEISLEVYTKDIRQATGFLAYIKNLINLSIDVVKKLGVKVEKISEQVLNCFDINQRIVELCNSCRCEGNVDDILILLKEINAKNRTYFENCPLVEPIDKWIKTLDEKNGLSQPIDLRMAADLQYESISEWMPYYRDQAETNIKIYNETFSDYSEVSDKMDKGIRNMRKIMEEIERNYSTWVIRYLMVIEKRAGLTIFSKKFGTFEMDTDLVSGFLTAIQSFGMEVTKKETSMRKLSYQDFEIEIEEGDYIRAALVLQGKITKYLVRNLFDYLKKFENTFVDNLQNFDGNITTFSSADEFTEELLLKGLDAGTCEVRTGPMFIPIDDEPLDAIEENIDEDVPSPMDSSNGTVGIPSLGRICSECGMPLQDDDEKCPRCGREL